jgi:hypothetical protein
VATRPVLCVLSVFLTIAVAGCEKSSYDDFSAAFPIARERKARPRPRPDTPMRPLAPAADAPPAAPAPAPELQLTPGVSVDARILIVTADGTDAAFEAIRDTLAFLGTPFDVLDATSGPTLTAATLAEGDHGRYQAIFLDVGDLSVNGGSAFSNDEWAALAAYEARFGVRRVAAYTFPTSAYGLVSTGGSIDPTKSPIQVRCSAAGAAALVGLNCANPVTIDAGFGYPARVAPGANTTALLSDGAGNVYAATTTYSDGREAMVLTFAQASNAFHTLQLGYGLVSWATRGLFVGERHAYLSAQIDDLFLASDLYPGTGATYRITDKDMQQLADWQNARRTHPLAAGLRLAWVANLEGSRGVASDPLTAKAVALGPAFSWISHTWDHADMNNMSYAAAYSEFTRNDQSVRNLGLNPYAIQNLVTPGISGLDNPNVMQAAHDVGIRQLVSDTSVDGQDNPSPNAGLWNSRVPEILMIPRFPTDLDYDASLPSEWINADNDRDGGSNTFEQIVAAESRVLAGHLLRGANDPWMFHQANTRNYGGGRSLLTDLLGATIDRYLASATLPIVSPNMDELATRVIDRMRLDASGVTATIGPGDSITVQVANAARVPVTGLCTADAETYGDQKIAYLDLAAGGSTTLSLAGCNAGGTTGTGGTGGGAAGTSGRGGAAGNGNTAGSGGTTGAAGTDGAGGRGGSNVGAAGSGSLAGSGGTTGRAGNGGGGGTNGAISGEAGARGEAGATGGDSATGAGGEGGSSKTPEPSGCDCAVTPRAPGSGLACILIAGVALLRRRRR